ncbi:MAG: hypothetical protein LBF40_00195 [Deltaproteobacteria bacterium]|nr:hypothetical protein [Deltaproteobacteria bacterium]
MAFGIMLSGPGLCHAAPPKAGAAKDGAAKDEKPEKAPAPKPISAKSLAHLYTLISGEPPLGQMDLEYYVAQLPRILALGEDPAEAHGILEETGWTEGRLAYVCVKVGIGLNRLLDPSDPKLRRYPLFVAPSEEELALIAQMEPAISKAYNQATRAMNQKNQKPRQQGGRRR